MTACSLKRYAKTLNTTICSPTFNTTGYYLYYPLIDEEELLQLLLPIFMFTQAFLERKVLKYAVNAPQDLPSYKDDDRSVHPEYLGRSLV